jgi:branched-chain amino acid transport system permease protein
MANAQSEKFAWTRAVCWAVVAILIIAFPIIAPNKFVVHVAIVALTFAVLASSWDLLFGYAGQISFGHAGFFGIGAYTSALLAHHFGVSPWIGLAAGGVMAALLGAVIGIPSLRLRGVYLALTTLAFSEVIRIIAANWHSVTRGTLGMSAKPYPGIPFHTTYYYYLMLILAVLAVGTMFWLANYSRVGLIFRAIKADDIRCRSLGVDILRYKVIAFALSGFFAGIAGAFSAHYLRLINPGDLAPQITIFAVAMAVIGGVGTIIGPAIAAIVVHGLMEYLKVLGAVYSLMAVGALLVLFVIFMPTGIAGQIPRKWLGLPVPEPQQSEKKKESNHP